jgi:hypothetical protein
MRIRLESGGRRLGGALVNWQRCCTAATPARPYARAAAVGGRFEHLIEQRTASGNEGQQPGKARHGSSWDAVEAGGGRGGGADFLYELGRSANYNTNVTTGQNISMIDSLFTGGHAAAVAIGMFAAASY